MLLMFTYPIPVRDVIYISMAEVPQSSAVSVVSFSINPNVFLAISILVKQRTDLQSLMR